MQAINGPLTHTKQNGRLLEMVQVCVGVTFTKAKLHFNQCADGKIVGHNTVTHNLYVISIHQTCTVITSAGEKKFLVKAERVKNDTAKSVLSITYTSLQVTSYFVSLVRFEIVHVAMNQKMYHFPLSCTKQTKLWQ